MTEAITCADFDGWWTANQTVKQLIIAKRIKFVKLTNENTRSFIMAEYEVFLDNVLVGTVEKYASSSSRGWDGKWQGSPQGWGYEAANMHTEIATNWRTREKKEVRRFSHDGGILRKTRNEAISNLLAAEIRRNNLSIN